MAKKIKLKGSGKVRYVRYYTKTQEMIVESKQGGERIFYGVPKELYLDFKRSDNPDSFYGRSVVLHYPSEKVQPCAMSITIPVGDQPEPEIESDDIDFQFFTVGGSDE